MRHRINGVLIHLILWVAVVCLGGCNQNPKPRVEKNVKKYDATKEISLAMENYNNPSFVTKANSITAYEATQKKVSLVICGMTTPSCIESILDMLSEYDITATFACDGMTGAGMNETVAQIHNKGHIIANYGLQKEKHWEEIKAEQLINSLSYTQAIIRQITGKYPQYAIGNATNVNDNLLHITACSGIENYIEGTKFINDNSFKDFGEALGFVERTKKGSIICIKLDDSLDEIEYEPYEVDETPAKDKKPSLKDELETDSKLSIIKTIEYLLEALDTTLTCVVPIDRLYVEPDKLVDKSFEETEGAIDYQVEECKPYDINILDKATFIGDSLTLAFSYYHEVSGNASICAYKSVSPMEFVNNTKVKGVADSEIAIWDEVCKTNPDRIYILLGTNALASGSNSAFITYYDRLITMLKEQFVNKTIYILGIPPVSKRVSEERITLNNGRIRKVNVELVKLAHNKSCHYIDLYTALSDSEGNLADNLSGEDGIHMNKMGCQTWIDYILCHVAKEDVINE